MKLDLLTNATVVKDAIRFVSDNNNKKVVKDISSVGSSGKRRNYNEPSFLNNY